MATLFQISNFLTLPFWLLMIALPTWRWTRRIIGSPWIAAPAAMLYAALVAPRLGELLPLLANPSLSSIAALLGTPAGATLAWVHMLAFDVFAGRWSYLDSQARGISPWLMAPVLLCILLVGPLGFLLYLIVREVTQRLRGVSPHATLTQPGA